MLSPNLQVETYWPLKLRLYSKNVVYYQEDVEYIYLHLLHDGILKPRKGIYECQEWNQQRIILFALLIILFLCSPFRTE